MAYYGSTLQELLLQVLQYNEAHTQDDRIKISYESKNESLVLDAHTLEAETNATASAKQLGETIVEIRSLRRDQLKKGQPSTEKDWLRTWAIAKKLEQKAEEAFASIREEMKKGDNNGALAGGHLAYGSQPVSIHRTTGGLRTEAMGDSVKSPPSSPQLQSSQQPSNSSQHKDKQTPREIWKDASSSHIKHHTPTGTHHGGSTTETEKTPYYAYIHDHDHIHRHNSPAASQPELVKAAEIIEMNGKRYETKAERARRKEKEALLDAESGYPRHETEEERIHRKASHAASHTRAEDRRLKTASERARRKYREVSALEKDQEKRHETGAERAGRKAKETMPASGSDGKRHEINPEIAHYEAEKNALSTQLDQKRHEINVPPACGTREKTTARLQKNARRYEKAAQRTHRKAKEGENPLKVQEQRRETRDERATRKAKNTNLPPESEKNEYATEEERIREEAKIDRARMLRKERIELQEKKAHDAALALHCEVRNLSEPSRSK